MIGKQEQIAMQSFSREYDLCFETTIPLRWLVVVFLVLLSMTFVITLKSHLTYHWNDEATKG